MGTPKGPPPGPLEDNAPYKFWVWECVLLDGLPAAFREAARREREARQVGASAVFIFQVCASIYIYIIYACSYTFIYITYECISVIHLFC